MNAMISQPDAVNADNVYRKITWRLMPFLFICYTVAFLDRINIGIAQLEMKHDVGFSDLVYGFGASIFFVGYIMMEVPSNLMIGWMGVRQTFARIMILWGLTAAATAFVTIPFHLYSVRFLLGVFEAGLYPGIIFYLTRWYPLDRRARIIALFTCSVGIAGLLGGPLSGTVMTFLSNVGGLFGWQWMFLVEGLPACVLGIVALFYLDNGPSEARWLTAEERLLVITEVSASNAIGPRGEHTFRRVVTDYRLYLMGFIGFGHICGLYAIGFWMPTIIKNTGISSPLYVGLLSAIPYFWSWVALIAIGRSSDRTGERRWHCAATAFAGRLGLVGMALFSHNLWLALAACSLSVSGILAGAPVGWAINTDYMRGRGSAGGIALLNTISLTGGIISPSIIGWTKTITGDVTAGLYVMAAIGVLGGFIAIIFVPGMLRHQRDDHAVAAVEVTL